MTHSSRKTYKDRAIENEKSKKDAITRERKITAEKAFHVDTLFTLRRAKEGIDKVDSDTIDLVDDSESLLSAIHAANGMFGLTLDLPAAGLLDDATTSAVHTRVELSRQVIQAANDILWLFVDEWNETSKQRSELDSALDLTREALRELKKSRREAFVLGSSCDDALTKRLDKDVIEKDRYSPTLADSCRRAYIKEGVFSPELFSDDDDEEELNGTH